MPTILITGSNGLVGRELIRAFDKLPQYTVIATSLSPDKIMQPDVAFHQLDVTNRKEVAELFGDLLPQVVIHSAAISAPDTCETDKALCNKVNIEGTKNVADACKAIGAKMLFISTDFVFDGDAGPYKEEDAPSPISYYGWSKLEGEKITQTLDNWSIVRTVLVYGDTVGLNRSNFVTWVKGALEKGEKIKVVNDQQRTPTYAPDLAYGIVKATEWLVAGKANEIWHISGPEPLISVYDMALQIAAYYNLDSTLIEPIASASLNQPAKRPPVTGFILSKAEKHLNYKPIEFINGLEKLAL
ncbi:MAG: SDR family oxidoreductase [Sphingobacteriales bacterium JAD_PAG50586_3]|nr:MAG: SDR family oxidoreductase [Sphingobacteriales bacterium JAD_PAG50586_3]